MRSILCCIFFIACTGFLRAQRDCRNQEYQQQLLAANPQLAGAYEKVESFTKSLRVNTPSGIRSAGSAGSSGPTVITIPVVVHILYNNNAENISDAQVLSQLAVLNNDFSGNSTEKNSIPLYFAPLVADCGFRFELARVDPRGRATSGILRKWTGIRYFAYDDRAKSSARGGDDAWDADRYLNIWVCNTAGGLLGYSSLPGGPKEVDGVVVNTAVFGTLNTMALNNRGRTAVHEIGHWLNLRHIWGDAYCGDDLVDDTPPQARANLGCPGGEHFTCGSTAHGDMYMNFMDFTDDACMYMFTWGQRERMRALFAPGGARFAVLSSNALSGEGLPADTVARAAEPLLLSVYPNPSASMITVGTGERQDLLGKTCRVYNYMGQQVKAVVLRSQRQQLDISGLPNGIYFVKVDGMKATVMARVIKE